MTDDQFHRRLRSARALAVINYDALTSNYPHQLSSARKNPYQPPNTALRNLNNGAPSYDTQQCTGALWPTILDGPGVSQRTLDTLRNNVFAGTLVPIAPACTQAPKRGSGTQFPQLVQEDRKSVV